jgi:hypothetical protein
MKSNKSISLEIKYWTALEEYRKKKGLPSISSAMEEIVKKFFGEEK